MAPIRLAEVTLPEFGMPAEQPAIPAAMHRERMGRFADRLRDAGLDVAVVYADREHCANISYLTGFDPRFEEAALIVAPPADPVILAGPENMAIAGRSGYAAHLYPPFGLLGQDRSRTPPLAELLAAHGVRSGSRVGVLGWKYFGLQEAADPHSWSEAPSYLVDTLRTLAGPGGRVVNANALLMDPSDGLRATCEIEQIAAFEFANCHTSEAIKRVVRGIRPGMREFEAASLMQPIGLPLNCHMLLATGERARFGLYSPTGKVIERGEMFTAGYGAWGALNCRAGWLVADADELPGAVADYLERLVIPYFACIAEWWETIGIGVPGGAIDALVKRHLGDPFFGLFLPPGHLIHLDEWMSTPIYPGSTETLRSGQAIQCDVIPATGGPYFTINIEDGLALLDEAGRHALRERFPDAWARIEARRAFMADVIGIRPKPEVLPLGNIPTWLPPFLLGSERVLVRR